MYVPDHFREVSPEEIADVMATAPLACVVAMTGEGLIANHLPLLMGAEGALIGHVALANDMHRLVPEGAEVLAVFRGVEGYVSPAFYPGKAEHHRVVPTWNYQAVHVHGTIAFSHDDKAKRAAVGLLTRARERALHGPEAWRMADAPADYMAEMLANIVAFRVTPGRVLAKSKLSQNRDPRDHAGAVEGLRASGAADLAQRMATRGPARE